MAKSKSSNGSKRGRGRPSNFTPENRQKILQAISLGTPLTMAPMAGGIRYSQFRTWIIRGEKEAKGDYHDFALEVETAKSNAVTRWLAMIEKAAKEGSWQAAAWKLERKYPNEFGRRERLEHTGKDGKPIEVSFPNLNNDKTRTHYRALFEADRGGTQHSPSGSGGNGRVRN